MSDNIRRSVSYQVMAQPQGQDITVTFADGTTFTARYAGSGHKAMREGTVPYSYITLHMITEMDAEISKPGEKRCCAVRTVEQFHAQFPDAGQTARPAKYPCVCDKDHSSAHRDEDGDKW